LPDEIYALSDIFCPNESETEILTGMPVKTLEEAEKAARKLKAKGAGMVILTLGERGSLLVTDNAVDHIPVEPARAIDTTGAGDCFVGSLAYFLAAGVEITDAVKRANYIASISVQSSGTQLSYPEAGDLPSEILKLQDNGGAGENENIAGWVTKSEMAGYIDHTLLKPEAKQAAFDQLCAEAVQHGFKSVCVNSSWVSYVAGKLQGSGIPVCSVIGFPLGAYDSQVKAYETQKAVADGAEELDMVINIGALKTGNLALVEEDIRAVRKQAERPIILKVIIETCLLSDEEKIKACQIAKQAGADFVKTSTGFSSGGATLKDIALMRRTVGPDMGVKASGGIKDFKTAQAMINAGASRIGAGAGVAILKD
jgi:deoxyribose-phosphate aldolase